MFKEAMNILPILTKHVQSIRGDATMRLAAFLTTTARYMYVVRCIYSEATQPATYSEARDVLILQRDLALRHLAQCSKNSYTIIQGLTLSASVPKSQKLKMVD